MHYLCLEKSKTVLNCRAGSTAALLFPRLDGGNLDFSVNFRA